MSRVRQPEEKTPPAGADKSDWCTPPEILECVYRMGSIGLDPCGHPKALVKARNIWTGPEHQDADALDGRSWRGHGLVFMNPPYGKGLDHWVTLAREQFQGVNFKDEIFEL